MCALYGEAISRGDPVLAVMPIDIARAQFCGCLITLQNHRKFWFVVGHIDGAVEQGFIGNHASGFDPAGCSNNRLGCAIVNPHGQFVGRKSAKDN